MIDRFAFSAGLLALLLTGFAALPARAADCGEFEACLALYGDPADWDREMRLFAMSDAVVPREEGAIVATGSSSMRFWHERIKEDLAPLTIIPRGFGGSTMNDVLHHLDALVLQYNPRAVMIYEGDNDVALGVSNEVIIDRYRQAMSRIYAHDESTRIYLISVKPSISRLDMWPQMRDLNRQLEMICGRDEQCTWLDVATPMLKADGTPIEDIFVGDDLHMNARGYGIWRAAIRPTLLRQEIAFEPFE